MRWLEFAILIVLVGSQTCLASDCSLVDLRSSLLGPAWNKGAVPFCNDYSAADLVSQRLGKKVSPLDMALNFNRKAWAEIKKDRENYRETSNVGGSAVGAVERTQDRGGFCLETDFRSELSRTHDLSLMEELNRVQELASNSPSHQEKSTILDDKECKLMNYLQEIFPLVKVSEALKIRLASSAYDILRNFQEKACKNRIPAKFKMKELYDTNKTDTGKILDIVDEQLERRNMVTLYYDANFLLAKPVPNASHSSTIVGRRKNPTNGQCEYLVRNSWGSCEVNQYPYECIDGNIWIPRATLTANTYGYAYIE